MLIWMGYGMIRNWDDQSTATEHALRTGPLVSGIMATSANPYFFLWWVTVGAMLVSRSLAFGFAGFVLLTLTHWLCDLGWESFVGYVTYRSRRLWTPLVHRVVFTACGLCLVGFGAYFGVSAMLG